MQCIIDVKTLEAPNTKFVYNLSISLELNLLNYLILDRFQPNMDLIKS